MELQAFFLSLTPLPPHYLLANKGSAFTFYTEVGMKGKGGSHYGLLADNAMFNERKKAYELYLKSWRCTMAR
jgi:hypothetical protein